MQEYEVSSFWFNPNIEPEEEYAKRKESLAAFVKSRNLHFYCGPEKYIWQNICEDRHKSCYTARLMETAGQAVKLKIPCFSTTLLSSPYQNHKLVISLGNEIASSEGLKFVYKDFRPFYYDGVNEARRLGYYMQKYCGCLESLKERKKRKVNAAIAE
jgi:predicted adenine nucleotide alpha hydrolase (AANH) superfamily ATPase